jgi:hypothetical protein
MPKKFLALNKNTSRSSLHSAPDLRFTHHALRSTQNPQLATLNPQPILRITLYAPQGYNLGIKVVINKWVRKNSNSKEG